MFGGRMKPVYILSIDYDYFQDNLQKHITNLYPKGFDVVGEESLKLWIEIYSDKRKEREIKKVKINFEKLQEIYRMIVDSSYRKKPIVQISASHKDIYGFITSNVPKDNNIKIVNIDLHHDAFNGNEELDCGNWVKHIKANYKNCDVKWIANKTSKYMYGMDEQFDFVKENFDDIEHITWDYIFICKSENFVPPHLDKGFNELAYMVKAVSRNNPKEDKSLTQLRSRNGFVGRVKELRKIKEGKNNGTD